MTDVRIAAVGALFACAAICGCEGSPYDPQAHEQFLSAVKAGNASVVVFPACVRSRTAEYNHEVGAALAAYFNDSGFARATVSEQEPVLKTQWQMNQAKMWRQSAESFRAHIAEHPIDADYALLAEYLLLGDGGVGGIHCYVVDRQGRLAEGLLLNSHHEEFSEANPQTIDDCTKVLEAVIDEAWRRNAD
ncbi:MAG: hypothetical protein D6744_07660 [Planctomycetota bacterium]|nr:MAG: hypothetical protein D6744_07660 [Planctomycetota bacterium]